VTKIDKHRTPVIIIACHGPTTFRRIGWRFVKLGYLAVYIDLELETFAIPENSDNATMLVDLGMSDPQIEKGFAFLSQHFDKPISQKTVVLVPKLVNQKRPQWAELGVAIVLDRVCPPPEIVSRIHDWLKFRSQHPIKN
jgi:hypothetical protein